MSRRLALTSASLLVGLSTLLAWSAQAPAVAGGPTTLRVAYGSYPDYMDPQLSYTAEGWSAMGEVYIPLLTFRHTSGKAGTEVVPGLARSMPRVSDGGRTYTLFLQPGLEYSDGTPVRATDFEYAIERLFRMRSGGAPLYSVIVGAPRYSRTGRGGIAGIVADNRTGRIVIHLRRASSTFPDLLALMFAAPVPPTTPLHDQSSHPPPATGPYVIGRSRPGIGWSYARNPAWAAHNEARVPQVPSGHVDKIEVHVIRDPYAEVSEVLAGKIDWMQNPPPAPLVQELAERYKGTQLRFEQSPSTYYFWLNTTRPPFNDVRVRRAVNYAVDANALQRIYFGQLTPTHEILPPSMPGYGGFDLYPYDLAKARRMIAAAHPRDRRVTVWTDTESQNLEAGKYFAAVLRRLGFHAHVKVVSSDNYFTAIGNSATPNLDAGWADWFQDFPHPDDFFRPQLLGSSIQPVNNYNLSRIDVPALNAKINHLSTLPLSPTTERHYTALDRSFMKLAPWVPFGTQTLTTFVSSRVDLDKVVSSPVFYEYLTSFELR